MSKKKLMVVDGSSLLFRAFYALPLLTTKEGIYTNGIYGFLTMLYSALESENPDYISVAFDKSGPTFRHEMYEEYKGTRTSPPDEIKQQFPMIKEVLKAMNINYLELDEYEADDIAGTLAKKGEDEGLEVVLFTGDKDYLQLVDENTRVVITKKGISETDIYTLEKIREDYGLSPAQLIDLKGLMGDSSDNIPGVPGIGEKTGLKLILDYGSIEGVYENIDKITGPKRRENLINNQDKAYLSRELGTIIRDVPLDLSLEDLKYEEANWESLTPLYERFEFTSLLEKYGPERVMEVRDDYDYELIKIEDFPRIKAEMEGIDEFSFKFIIDGENYMTGQILYLGMAYDGKIKILEMEDELDEFILNFRGIFENPAIKKIGHNLKNDMVLLFRMGIDVLGIDFDTMIAKYLIDPSQSDYSINELSDQYDNYYGKDLEDILGKGKHKKSFRDLELEELSEYLCFSVDCPLKLRAEMESTIKDQNMLDLFYNIELPLTKVLASMEYEGFKIDKSELRKLEEEFSKEIDSLTLEIHEMAGSEFNINSPKQLGFVLFEDLELPVIKKTKTGYSTNAEVLDKLKNKHPIIDKVLRYRQVVKLKSTYIDGLLELVNEETGRIHSTFNQTVTTTGRISSTEPNLQNIPIRTHDGRQIRRAFIADENMALVDADYSQIELRVLAHISDDENMIDAFKNNLDIHTRTASQVFGVDEDKVNPELRARAKAVNFGIVYGISDYGLSQDLNITRNEAKLYIDSYLDNYKNVKKYMDEIVELGKEQGYVETILNRRRYIPELKDRNFNIRSFGERIAMNTPIQGSAADIIKLAMVRVYDELKKRGLKSRLILQVHDELIIEATKDEEEEVKKLLREIMEDALELRVPLPVDLKVGDSWYDTL